MAAACQHPSRRHFRVYYSSSNSIRPEVKQPPPATVLLKLSPAASCMVPAASTARACVSLLGSEKVSALAHPLQIWVCDGSDVCTGGFVLVMETKSLKSHCQLHIVTSKPVERCMHTFPGGLRSFLANGSLRTAVCPAEALSPGSWHPVIMARRTITGWQMSYTFQSLFIMTCDLNTGFPKNLLSW